MGRFTTKTKKVHPQQKDSYIIASPGKGVIAVIKGKGPTTYFGEAINELGRYEEIGTVEEVREAIEFMKTMTKK